MLTVVETTPGWLDTYSVPDAMSQTTILGLVLGNTAPLRELTQTTGLISKLASQTPRPESTGLSGSTLSQIMCQPLGKLNRTMVLETTLKAVGDGAFEHWNPHSAKVAWFS